MQTYNHDICINLTKTTGTPKNGDYLPYKERTYTFPSQTLRGLFTLVDDELKASGDVYREDGVITRKYAYAKYTTCNSASSYDGMYYATFVLSPVSTNNNTNFITNKGIIPVQFGPEVGKAYILGNGATLVVYFNDQTLTTKALIDAYLANSPLEIVYEKATPTTEQAEPLVMPQICYKDGTEENLTNGIVPVGHESTYYNYPDYMEEGEYKDFRDRVDYAAEKAKWHQVGIYANGDTITIDGYYNEIMLVPNHYSGTTLLACASPAIFPFSLFKSITLQNSTESERIDITPAGVVGVTGTYFSNVTVFVR